MSPQFASVGGFSSNAFNQMPTATAPTQSSSATYPPMNARATINTNGYGRFCECVHDCTWICVSVIHLSLFSSCQMAPSLERSSPLEQQRQCGPSGRPSSIHRVVQSSTPMLRATNKTCFLWVFSKSFPTVLQQSCNLCLISIYLVWNRMFCQCWTSLPTSTVMILRFPCTLHLMSDLVVVFSCVYLCLLNFKALTCSHV